MGVFVDPGTVDVLVVDPDHCGESTVSIKLFKVKCRCFQIGWIAFKLFLVSEQIVHRKILLFNCIAVGEWTDRLLQQILGLDLGATER